MFTRVKPWTDAALVALALLLLTIGFATFLQWSGGRPDATAYWRAAVELRAGRPLYAPAASLDKAYLYPPAFAALFAPLTLLPPVWGYALWMASHFALVPAAVRCLESLYGVAEPGARSRHRLLLGALLLGPLVGELREGQVNLLVLALVAAGALAVERDAPRLGGVLFALAAHVKLMPAVLLLVLIAQRRRAAALSMLAGLAALSLLPMLAGASLTRSVSYHADYFSMIAAPALGGARIAGEEQFFVLNGSFAGVLHRWFSDSPFTPFPALAQHHGPLIAALPRPLLRAVAGSAALAMLVAALLRAVRAPRTHGGLAHASALVLIATQLGSPTFWEHHLVVLALLLTPLAEAGPDVLIAAAAPFVAALALPYALALGSLLAGNDPAGDWLTASRTWGGPTLAVCWLWLFAYRRAGTPGPGVAPQ